MLAKRNRVDRKLMTEIFKNGSVIYAPSFIFKYAFIQKQDFTKISFVCPKKLFKKAVERNYWRRLGYSSLTNKINKLPSNLAGVFIFNAKSKKLNEEIENIFKKIK